MMATLEQLTMRCGSMGEAAAAAKDERAASDLFAAERALATTRRRLERLLATS